MKKLLITGGSGFLGKRLGKCLKNNYNVILGSRNNKQNFAAEKFSGCETYPLDVTNIESVRDAIFSIKPDIIIHAAATKFVDLAEKQPMECIDVNVLGSENIARVSMEKNVEFVLGISTDKASPPVRNTYGMSKAIMERLFCSVNNRAGTKFACVRYGNVAWSTGSVLPIWKKMFEETGVIGTTGPEMRRFFFTVDDAVQLVINALYNIDKIDGKVLSVEMKSALIGDILNIWVEHKGGKWEKIGGRPGERNDEYLIGELELPFSKTINFKGEKHFIISFNEKSLTPLNSVVSSATVTRLNKDEIIKIIDNPPFEEL